MSIDQLLNDLRDRDIRIVLEGDELVVRGVRSALEDEIVSVLREKKDALREHLRAFEAGLQSEIGIPSDAQEITPEMIPLVSLAPEQIARIVASVPGGVANIQDIYRLAPLQEGLLFHHLLDASADPFVVRMMMRFDDRARLERFSSALQMVIDRHDILRTAIAWEGLDSGVQVVYRNAPLPVETIVLAAGETSALEEFSKRTDPRDARVSIRTAPMMRAVIAREEPGEAWLLALLMHHMAVDHTTLHVMLEEVGSCLLGKGEALPPTVPFREYIARATRSSNRERHEAFFSSMLADVTEPTTPLGITGVRGDGADSNEAARELPAPLASALRERARALGVNVASIVHVAWASILARLSSRDDVVFGTVLSGRLQGSDDSHRAAGLFINTLPIRLRVAGVSVAEAVRVTHRSLAELLEHEYAPLSLAQRCSGIAPPAPLFCAGLNYRHAGGVRESDPPAWDGIEILSGDERSTYPFTLSFDDMGDRFGVMVQVDPAVDADRICEMVFTVLDNLTSALASTPQMLLTDLDVVGAPERDALRRWNATERPYADGACVHELFEAQVAVSPSAPALVDARRTLSYADVNAEANRLAHHLRSLGVAPGARIALCMERGVETIIALLAVLKAGGAYVPIDPSYPAERVRFMLEDSQPSVILTHGAQTPRIAAMLADVQATVLDLGGRSAWHSQPSTNLERNGLTPRDLAYVIYTSGSTGRPKGVMIEHGGVCNLAAAQGAAFVVDERSRVLQFASPSFDATVSEVFVTFAAGGALVVPSAEMVLAGAALVRTIEEFSVTHATLPPAILTTLEPGTTLLSLRTLVVAGEACSEALVRRWAPGRRFINAYGPTESTVCATLFVCDPQSNGNPPIGAPIGNAHVYVLDEHGQPTPIGVTGELYIGGAGVALGYLNRPELTQERFVSRPCAPGERLYRTGDLGRWRADGVLEFAGRNDHQVKLRGFRVELGEIEAVLEQHAAVREAIVVVREDLPGERRLVAYYTSSASVDTEALRAHVASALPEYMTPAAFVALDAFTLTPNGKIDRRALPSPGDDAHVSQTFEAPQGEIETAIARIWCELLGIERAGRSDDFFELGGHSLLALRVLSALQDELSVELDLGTLFDSPTLSDFAAIVTEAIPSRKSEIPLADRSVPLPLSFAQQRLWVLTQIDGASEAYHVPMRLRLKGKLDYAALAYALDAIAQRHEILRTTFVEIDGTPVQRPSQTGGISLEVIDLRTHSDAQAALEEAARAKVSEPFDLTSGPVARAHLFALSEDDHVLLVTIHHIVSDGWSIGIFVTELSAFYSARLRGESASLPPLPLQYADYAAWQREALAGDGLRAHLEYWTQALHEAPPVLRLPLDRARPEEQNFDGEYVWVEIDETLTARLKRLSEHHGTTLFMTIMAGFAALLSRLSGQRDVVIGTPTANRTRSELDAVIGFFVNTLALHIRIPEGTSVGDLLATVKTQSIGAQQHQDLPFEHVVDAVNPVRSLAITPLFQVMFGWQNNDHGRFELPGLTVSGLDSTYRAAKFDLTLELGESDGRIAGALEYATSLFDRESVERFVAQLRAVLTAMCDETLRVDELPLALESSDAGEATHNEILVLDRRGRRVEIGVVGELVRRTGATLERTGEAARYRRDGRIELVDIGNADLRELESVRVVEAAIRAYHGVSHAAVAPQSFEGSRHFIAWYVCQSEDVGAAELATFCAQRLPSDLMPVRFIAVPSIAAGIYGAPDRLRLSETLTAAAPGDAEALSEVEEQIARVWRDVLGVEDVRRNDNFFELQGNSLLAVRMVSRLRQRFDANVALRDVFARPVLRDLAEFLSQASRNDLERIQPMARPPVIPLATPQRGMWLVTQREGASHAFHVPLTLRLFGDLDVEALQRALDRIVERHEILRSVFAQTNELPHLQASGSRAFPLEILDGSALDVHAWLKETIEKPFDLSNGPVVRGSLARVSPSEHVLALVMHHIVVDGWSLGIFARELRELYGAFSVGGDDPLTPLPLQYADYAIWQERAIRDGALERQRRYWKSAMEGAPVTLELPTDRARSANRSYAGDVVDMTIPEDLTKRLRRLSRESGATLHATLLSGWAALLARLSRQAEVVVGSASANRSRSELETLIGLFINTLPIRVDCSGDPTAHELVSRTRDAVLRAHEHQDLPFEQIVEVVQPRYVAGQTPLFQSTFEWQTGDDDAAWQLQGVRVEPIVVSNRTTKFDLTLELAPAGEGIRGGLVYATALFERATAERFARLYVQMLEGLAADESRN